MKGDDEGERVRARVLKRLVCLEVRVLVFGHTDQGFPRESVQSGGKKFSLLGDRDFCRLG